MKLEITGQMCDPVGQQLDLPVGVTMTAAAYKAAHGDIDAQLFLQLPPEAGLGGLALLDLPPRELPFVRKAVPAFATGNEDPAVLFEDCGSNRDSSDIKARGSHPFQTLTTRIESVKAKTLESGVELWNKRTSF
jgi:hypothetical protein